jgi:outer membrane lipoprotein SlyB
VYKMKNAMFLVSLSMLFVGCETKTQTGALTGAAVGVGAGALIGGGGGALIGGAAGAVGGALIGMALDDADRKALETQNPRTLRKIDRGEPLNIDDIKQMSRAGIKDDVIISQIQATDSHFHLTSDEIIDLKNSGVSQRVINAMIRSGNA